MSMILSTVIGALAPAVVEGLKQLVTRFTGGVRATTVAEQIQLDAAEVERLKALAALDNPGGTPSQWVIDLRASTRYLGALVSILGGLATLFIPELDMAVKAIGLEVASVAFGFLFGHRILVNFKGK